MANVVQLNVLTTHMRSQLAKISSGAITKMSPITHIAFGDGGVDVDGEPIAPNEGATALTHEVGRYPVETVTYPISTTARYTVIIPKGALIDSSKEKN